MLQLQLSSYHLFTKNLIESRPIANVNRFPFPRPFSKNPDRNAFVSLTTVSKSEGEHTALVQVELVLVRFGDVQDLHVIVLHPDCQPLARWTVAQ